MTKRLRCSTKIWVCVYVEGGLQKEERESSYRLYDPILIVAPDQFWQTKTVYRRPEKNISNSENKKAFEDSHSPASRASTTKRPKANGKSSDA